MSEQKFEYNYRLFHFISYTYYNYGHYVTQEKAIKRRDISTLIFPNTCIGFELFDRVSRQSDIDDTVFIGEVVNRSQYYIGKTYNLNAVAQELGTDSPIYRELKADNATRIVKVCSGEYVGVCPEDTILAPRSIQRADDFAEKSSDKDFPTMSR